MKNAVVLNSWYGHKEDNWYLWLMGELEKKDYKVVFPDLPTIGDDYPKLSPMLKVAEPLIDENTLVIGHSLGALLGLRLAEKKKFAKLILVSGWDFNDLFPNHINFWPNNLDHKIIKENVKEFVVIHGSNDPYTTPWGAKEMAKRLGAQVEIIENGGHLCSKDGFTQLPQILSYT